MGAATGRGDITSAEALSKPASCLGGHGVTLAVAHLHKPAKEMAAKPGLLEAIGHDHEFGNVGLAGSALPASAKLTPRPPSIGKGWLRAREHTPAIGSAQNRMFWPRDHTARPPR